MDPTDVVVMMVLTEVEGAEKVCPRLELPLVDVDGIEEVWLRAVLWDDPEAPVLALVDSACTETFLVVIDDIGWPLDVADPEVPRD